jgi:hypothetical protein
MNNPERERERLADLYASMSDEELEKIAAAGYELSDAAHQSLEAEIAHRGAKIAIAPDPGFDTYELNKTVTVRQFRDLHEALLAKGCLESAGVYADLVDDNMVRLDWFYSNLLGGIKLKVRPEDVDTAKQILEQPIPETLEIEGVGTYDQPRCPRCGSLDVNFQELNKLASFGSAYLGVPIPVHRRAWTCHTCRHEWEDNGDTESRTEAPDS